MTIYHSVHDNHRIEITGPRKHFSSGEEEYYTLTFIDDCGSANTLFLGPEKITELYQHLSKII